MLSKRLEVVQHNDYQSGFQSGRSASQNINLLKSIIDHRLEKKSDLYISFLDFRKTFDSIDHQMLITLLKGLGLSLGLFQCIRTLYTHTYRKIGGVWVFQVRGVLQGDPLSPVLFKITLDYVLNKLSPLRR